ncbi:hypothetical protein GQ457_09G022600 [Hibiscus cannabinus]
MVMEPSSSKHGCRLFQLPQSLILDILSRLSIIDILHCKCVSKRLLCFVSGAEFARLHLSRSPLCILINSRPRQRSSSHRTFMPTVKVIRSRNLTLHPYLMYPLGISLISPLAMVCFV